MSGLRRRSSVSSSRGPRSRTRSGNDAIILPAFALPILRDLYRPTVVVSFEEGKIRTLSDNFWIVGYIHG
jgi:hypothetical protein